MAKFRDPNIFSDHLADIVKMCSEGRGIVYIQIELNKKIGPHATQINYDGLKSYIRRTEGLYDLRLKAVAEAEVMQAELVTGPMTFKAVEGTIRGLAGKYPYIDELIAKYGTSEIEGPNPMMDPFNVTDTIFFGLCRCHEIITQKSGFRVFQDAMATYMTTIDWLEKKALDGAAGIDKVMFAIKGMEEDSQIDFNRYVQSMAEVEKLENEKSKNKPKQLGLFA